MARLKMATRAIHTGERYHPEGAHTPPIFQTGTFIFNSLKDAIQKFNGELEGYEYTRLGNPNFRIVEEKIASLEGAEDGLVFCSGMAAITTTMLNLLRNGGHGVCTQTLYGCTDTLFSRLLSQLGITFTFVDTRDPENVENAITRDTRVIFLEPLANPTLDISDIRAIAEIAHRRNLILVADNSLSSPYNTRPIELGADIAIESSTKFLNGHGDIVSGTVASSRWFLREKPEPLLFWRSIMGPVPSPFDCWLLDRGLKTFAERMKKHNSNALKLAYLLENHSAVKRVIYPGLPSHPQHELAKRQMITPAGKPGFGGMISFELKGGEKALRRFFKYLTSGVTTADSQNPKFIALAVSLGYIETLIEWPAKMTHAIVPEEERLAKGIANNLIRLAVGIEDPEDLEETFGGSLDAL